MLRDTIRRELTIAYDHGVVAGERQWPASNKGQVLEEGTTRIEQAIEIARQSRAANVAARVAAEAKRAAGAKQ